MSASKKGFAGQVASLFVRSKLTPVIAIISLLMGFLAVYLTPKEEEPQILVPMIDIHTSAPGFHPKETELKVTEVIERAVWGLEGVEYVYSASSFNNSLVTVRFKVGETMEPSLVKVHHKLMTLRDKLPPTASTPVVKSYTVDDVPFLVLSFSSASRSDFQLREQVATLARELSSTPELGGVEILGGQQRVVRVEVDPKKMAEQGVSLTALAEALRRTDALGYSGKNWSDQTVFTVEVGRRLQSADDVKQTVIGQFGGRLIHVSDVAKITDGPEEKIRGSVLFKKGQMPERAVSIVFSKRKGADIVHLSNELIKRAQVFMQGMPSDLKMTIVRDYGQTADLKTKELIEHLLLASISVSVLIALFMGIRAAIVVGIAIPVTFALTLVVYYLFGYTLNRVTLFALIFSVGILVDDAIVVVENIERHTKAAGKKIISSTIAAVSEVGNSTTLATFTVIAAILPMAFVGGLAGPYMKPIPVGGSFAMILSLLVAFIITPWAAVKLLKARAKNEDGKNKEKKYGKLYRFILGQLLRSKIIFFAFGLLIFLLFLAASSMLYFKTVRVKLLPFDNKQEFQVLLDYPSTTPLSQNIEWSKELAAQLIRDTNVDAVQIFAGEPSPYSFSGMMKHTFLRRSDYKSDLQVVLKPKNGRKIQSHEIIQNLRPVIAEFGEKRNALTKVLEIPPGPPVIATLMAEVYGPSEETRQKTAEKIKSLFAADESVVDLDTSMRLERPRLLYAYNPTVGGLLGIRADTTSQVGQLVFSENALTSLSDASGPESISLVLAMEQAARSSETPFKALLLPSPEAGSVDISKLFNQPIQEESAVRYRKNLKPVVYVTSELAGAEEAPVYNILKIAPQIKVPLQTAEVPWNTTQTVVKWDGEWFITYEVFRDLGTAFLVVMILIYILVLGWFRSFAVPLVIMAPIPISLIGILPGHALLGVFFTATSMIGFIAGAGIIVRNSIILVDFIEQQLLNGLELKTAVINAGLLRFRPMLLTAAAVVVGSSVILFDPIFQGLAVSLIFGEVAGTLLSRFAVPVLYYWLIGEHRRKTLVSETSMEGESV